MEDFDNCHFKSKISYGRKNSKFACAEVIQIANRILRIYAQTPFLYKWIFALYADNPRKQAFQCTHKQKFHYRMFCALRRNSKFGSIHTSRTPVSPSGSAQDFVLSIERVPKQKVLISQRRCAVRSAPLAVACILGAGPIKRSYLLKHRNTTMKYTLTCGR